MPWDPVEVDVEVETLWGKLKRKFCSSKVCLCLCQQAGLIKSHLKDEILFSGHLNAFEGQQNAIGLCCKWIKT